ncbi:MAG: hypothetical protein MK175_20190, partial [Pseudoalteromonas sp.]|nr:hypothetical protein [Pseudoalteromonas sp.]
LRLSIWEPCKENIFLRLFKLSDITLYSSDKSTPTLKLTSLNDYERLKNILINSVSKERTKHGVREFD